MNKKSVYTEVLRKPREMNVARISLTKRLICRQRSKKKTLKR